jgi:hypothetical protein
MFNENKYKKCINHLIGIKTSIVIVYMMILAVIGGIVGFALMEEITKAPITIIIAVLVGLVIGLIIGLCSIWRVEMKIQEAYWRIDILKELKKQNSSKGAPIAKAIVSIENKQVPNVRECKSEIINSTPVVNEENDEEDDEE